MSRFRFPHVEEPSLRAKARRCFLTIFCCFFIVFGVVAIAVSAALVSLRPAECPFLGDFYGGVYLLLTAGVVTSVVSLLACLQTHRGQALGGFLVCVCHVVVLVLMLQVFAAIASHVLYVRASDGGDLASGMEARWKSFRAGEKRCVDRLQREFECCGVDNDAEWVSLSSSQGGGGVVVIGDDASSSPYPSSCLCTTASGGGGDECVVRNSVFHNGSYLVHVHGRSCHDVVLDSLFDALLVPRVLGPVLSAVELGLLLAAIFIYRRISCRSVVGAYVVAEVREDGRRSGTASEPGSVDLPENGAVSLCGMAMPTRGEDSLSLSRDETAMHI